MFAMMKMPAPKHELKAAAKKILLLLTSRPDPIPMVLKINEKQVSIADINFSINAFREQWRMLHAAQCSWPAVELVKQPAPQASAAECWSPLDLAELQQTSPQYDEIVSGIAQARASERAASAGFEVIERTAEDMNEAFVEAISEIVARRLVGSEDHSKHPPTADFTVVTKTPEVEILYSAGYFLSTQQGFGWSTPATRSLPWGCYTFGANLNGEVRFSNTLWTIPDTPSIQWLV